MSRKWVGIVVALVIFAGAAMAWAENPTNLTVIRKSEEDLRWNIQLFRLGKDRWKVRCAADADMGPIDSEVHSDWDWQQQGKYL
jgi:hypothetical protein